MPMLTFGQLKHSGFAKVASADPCGAEFRRLANESVQLLLNRGDWRGTLLPIYVCVQNGCVTWPRYVHSVRKLNVCGREVQVNNIWYQFVERDFYSHWLGYPYWDIVRPLFPIDRFREMNAGGYFSTYNDVPSISYIQAYPMLPSDVGKTVTIFGKDANGQTLRYQDATTGLWQDGCVIKLTKPYGQSAVTVRPQAPRVVKDETDGDVRLYAADATTGLLTDLAIYAASERAPSYARYQLHAHHHCPGGGQPFGVMALVKLEYIPVKFDGDLVLIDNIEALKLACQGIKEREAGNNADARGSINEAVEALNKELRNEMGDSSIPINIRAFGKATPRRHAIGHMI